MDILEQLIYSVYRQKNSMHNKNNTKKWWRNTLSTILAVLLLPLSTTFMAWKALSLATNSPVPIVCVISESMAPTFHRGDILLLSNWQQQPVIEVGDIPVVWFEGNPLPMVHRVIKVVYDDKHNKYVVFQYFYNDEKLIFFVCV